MTKNLLKHILIILVLFISSMAVVNSATTGLNVILSSQNPDPVSPGNFVYINVKVTNSGSTTIGGLTLEMLENDNFKVAQGEERVKDLGAIPSYSNSDTSTNFVIAKYKVLVTDNAPQGNNTVDFKATTVSGSVFNYEFQVLVQKKTPTLSVNKIDIAELEPGKSGKLTMELENTNAISLRNIILTLNLDDVTNKVLSVQSGSNQKTILSMGPGEKKEVTFDIVASPDADSKPYLIPITISYEDSLENSFSTNVLGSVRVFSTPVLSLNLDSQDMYSTGTGKVTLAIANPGTSTIKGTQVEIMPGEGYKVIDGSFQYVGDLNPDDFQTVQSNVYVSQSGASLNVKVKYLDSYNVQTEKTYQIPLKGFTSDELKSFGMNASTTTSLGWYKYIIDLIVLVGVFYLGRRFGYKKAKKKNN